MEGEEVRCLRGPKILEGSYMKFFTSPRITTGGVLY